MGDYRLLADSMWAGEKQDKRIHRGEVIELDDDARRTQQLVDAGLVVKKGEETDEQKKEFEGKDSKAELDKKHADEIKASEQEVLQGAGKKDNKTDKVEEPSQPAGAPRQVRQTK